MQSSMPSIPTLLSTLRSVLQPSSTFRKNIPSIYKLLLLAFALLNLKVLPSAWHFRLLRGLLVHIRNSKRRLRKPQTAPSGPSTLFLPLITTSRAAPLECDYNFHKSNSTYFTDSDVGRLHLVVALCARGMDRVRAELRAEATALSMSGTVSRGGGKKATSAGLAIHLGGIAANFRREIKPLEKFEVWTRVLAWDGKWLYLVQHFVKPGVGVKKGRHLLQDGTGTRRGGGSSVKVVGNGEVKKENGHAGGANGHAEAGTATAAAAATAPHPAIFATLIARYVFKTGRRTVTPERVLRASDLLPRRPEDGPQEAAVANGHVVTNESVAGPNPASEGIKTVDDKDESKTDGEWTWARVEEERVRGMRMAEWYAKLDELHGEFPDGGQLSQDQDASGVDILGEF